MAKGQGPEATVESAATPEPTGETTNTHPEEQPTPEAAQSKPGAPKDRGGQPKTFGTRLGAVLAGMDDVPAEILKPEIEAAEEEGGTEPEVEEIEGQPASAEATAGSPSREATGEEDKEDQKPLPQDWPQSAKARVAAETKKRKTARAAVAAAEQERDELRQQVALLQGEQPMQVASGAGEDPLASVVNPKQLEQTVKDHQEVVELATVCPYGAVIVKNPDGTHRAIPKNERGEVTDDSYDEASVVKDYSGTELAQRRLSSERILRAAPTKVQYFQERRAFDGAARKIYPEVFDEKTGRLSENAKQLIQEMPGLMKHSDCLLNIGRWIRGAQLEQQLIAEWQKTNGKSPQGKAAAFSRPQPLRAPTPPAARTAMRPVGGNGNGKVDVESAEKRALESGGSEESIEDLVGILRNSQSRTAAEPAPI